MLKLSKTVEYALISLNHINQSDTNSPISVRHISDQYNIPYELLAKILQKLSKQNILESIHGPKGGYKLNNIYNNLNLIEFIEILEGPFGITGCLTDSDCDQLLNCNIITPLEKINSKLLVGADGGRSVVRKLANISTRTWSYGQTAFVTTLKSKKRHKNTAWQIFTSSGPIALLPFSNGKGANISLVWSAENDYAEVLKSLEDNNFVLELEKKTESILGSFELQDDLRFFPLNQLHVKNYFSKRTLLVGDAAHTIHPLAGQGLNLGFADILSLQQVLISARRRGEDIGTNKVLSKFENSRKLPNLSMIAMMELFKQGFNNSNPWIRLGRNLAFQTTQESGWIKRKFIKEAAGLT